MTDCHVIRFQALAPLQLPVDHSRAAPPLMGFVPNQAPGAPVSPIPVIPLSATAGATGTSPCISIRLVTRLLWVRT